MKATKKIVGATAALVAAIALSAGSTFAWFVSSNSVTANGMQISVASATNLLISESDSSGWTGALDMDDTATNVSPVSTAGSASGQGESYTAPSFYQMDTAGDDIDYNNGVVDTDTTTKFKVAETKNYINKTLYIKSVGQNATDLQATVTATTTGTAAVERSLRVLIIMENGTGLSEYFFAPIAGYDVAWKPIAGLSDTKPTLAQTPSNVAGAATATTLFDGTITEDTIYKLHIYVWFEGQDSNCTAANTINVGNITLNMTFNASAAE